MAHVLIIDDDELVRESLSEVIHKLGHTSADASSVAEALKMAKSAAFDLVFSDVRMPDGSGLDILPQLRRTAAGPEVIIITGYGDPDGAELAIKNGAWDYIEKPLSLRDVTLCVERALDYREKKQCIPKPVVLEREGIIGSSPRLRACFDILARAASSEANVLITGETGTGKEMFAWAVHKNSPRAGQSFVVLDCAALPETLVESTLFGHVRGAFTSADKAREGLIKQADGGTLFLDEVGELPLTIQRAFLRVLQERRFRPVGGSQEIESDFRLIAATNRDLDALVKEGRFREDLMFRLRTVVLDLPPLRELKDDIKEIVLYYVDKFCRQYEVEMKGFSPELLRLLEQYDWPGNVRELIQALEKAVVDAQDEPILFPKHLPEHIRVHLARAAVLQKRPAPPKTRDIHDDSGSLISLKDVREAGLAEIEKDYLRALMQRTQGDIPSACRISGLSRSRLYTLLKKYQISPSP
jgi:two-component system NtrC family response regulator